MKTLTLIPPAKASAAAALEKRQAIESCLLDVQESGAGLQEISDATGVNIFTASKIIAALVLKGIAVRGTTPRFPGMRRIFAAQYAPAQAANTGAASEARAQPKAKARTFHPFGETATYNTAGLQPVRSGAQDHLSVPSRRGNERVAHRPMMCMGSNISGGV